MVSLSLTHCVSSKKLLKLSQCLWKQQYKGFGEVIWQTAKDFKATENAQSIAVWKLLLPIFFKNCHKYHSILWDRRDGTSLLLLCKDKFLVCKMWLFWEAELFLNTGSEAGAGWSWKFPDLFIISRGYLSPSLCDSGKPTTVNKWMVFVY